MCLCIPCTRSAGVVLGSRRGCSVTIVSCLAAWCRGFRSGGSGPDVFPTRKPSYPVVYRIGTTDMAFHLGFRALVTRTQLDAVRKWPLTWAFAIRSCHCLPVGQLFQKPLSLVPGG